MYIEPKICSAISSHASRLAGQINGIKNMLQQNRSPIDILLLLMAAHASFNSFSSAMHGAICMDTNIILHTPMHISLQSPECLQLIENHKAHLQDCSLKQLLKILHSLKHEKLIG